MKQRLLLLFVSLLICATSMTAQTQYNCDFENDSENALWNMNITGNTSLIFPNKWYIGTAINNGGNKSLYISSDGGTTPGYSNGSMMVSARTILLDAGEYELSFDWLGGTVSGKDVLYAAWVPENIKTNSSQSYAKPIFMELYGLTPDASTPPVNDSLRSPAWKTSAFRFTSDGTPHKLVLTWTNNTNTSPAKGACIDNIQIIPAAVCDAPKNFQVTTSGSSVILSWQGTASSYEIRYYSIETKQWIYVNNITSNQITLNGLSEGIQQFYVRSICGSTNSRWESKSVLIYLPGTRCINYLGLTNQNCWTGNFADSGRGKKEKVDLGYENNLSRHTIHSVQNEYDARTGNLLRTIPDAEIASVRLGNWSTGAEAEQIEYTYKVDAANASVLVLKYAVVMNEPSTSHTQNEQSRFELKIFRANGASLEVNKCGEASFTANFDTQGDKTWHTNEYNSSVVWWKDWSTVGINLKEYDGETLKIRLTTSDCSLGGHFGYAYFTLGCSNGEMEGISCGNTPTNKFIAPIGFNYRWYLPDAPHNILSTNRQYNVNPSDTLTYNCDLVFPTNDSCFFTLSASAIPRYPVADAEYIITSKDCKNSISFANTSHIMLVNQISTDSLHTPLPCETAFWDFGDGTTSTEFSPTHTYPEEGGVFNVSLRVGISNNDCLSIKNFTIKLPRLGTTYDTIPAFGCLGKPWYMPDGQMKWGDGLYNYTYKSIHDCDSVIVYDLKFGSKKNVNIYDTICSGTSYTFDKVERTEAGVYVANHVSVYGCDSITTLYLTVLESLEIELSKQPEVCADASNFEIQYNLKSGDFTSYDIEYDTDAKAANFGDIRNATQVPIILQIPESIKPDIYSANIIFKNKNCNNDSLAVRISINYPSSIIVQRWNDVLAVKNRIYNGGYEFSGYQWYKNNVIMDGANESYLYLSEGLDNQAQYSIKLTRSDDNKSIFSCLFIPQELSEGITLSSSSSSKTINIKVETSGTAIVRNMLGAFLTEQKLNKGANEIITPDASGIYILTIKLTNNKQKTYRIQK